LAVEIVTAWEGVSPEQPQMSQMNTIVRQACREITASPYWFYSSGVVTFLEALLSDPIDQLVAIAAAWDVCCGSHIEQHGKHVATASYLAWATKNCARRSSMARDETSLMWKSDEKRLRSTDGAFAVRLLYGWWQENGNGFYNESDVVARLLPPLGGPDTDERTMVRLLTALARFGVIERVIGVRGRETTIKISSQGREFYEEFCNSVSLKQKPAAKRGGVDRHVH
jgi:hypothetical protein